MQMMLMSPLAAVALNARNKDSADVDCAVTCAKIQLDAAAALKTAVTQFGALEKMLAAMFTVHEPVLPFETELIQLPDCETTVDPALPQVIRARSILSAVDVLDEIEPWTNLGVTLTAYAVTDSAAATAKNMFFIFSP